MIVLYLGLSVALGAPTAANLPAVGLAHEGTSPPATVLEKVTELTVLALQERGVALGGPAPEDPAGAWVKAAEESYYGLEFDSAASQAQRAVKFYAEHPEHVGDAARLLKAHLFAALANQELGRGRKAASHFRTILTLRPQQELSSAQYSPAVIRAFETAKASMGKAKRITLIVSSKPGFAEVFLDGRSVGATPVTLKSVVGGRHVIRVIRDGHEVSHRWVDAQQRSTRVTLELTPSPHSTLRASIRKSLAADSKETSESARVLAQRLGTGRVLLSTVQPLEDRYVLAFGSVAGSGDTRRAYTTVDKQLTDAPERIAETVGVLLARGNSEPVAVKTSVELSFKSSLLGNLSEDPERGAADATATMTAGPLSPTSPPLTTASSAEEQRRPVWKSPWLWIAIGAVVAGGTTAAIVAAGGSDEPSVRLRLELPQ